MNYATIKHFDVANGLGVRVSLFVSGCNHRCKGCTNKDLFDAVFKYDYAIIFLPDGTSKTVEIAQWTDYADGDQIQIKATDGTIYLLHSMNCVLVNEK